jgi:hypothetical protein
MAMTVGMDITNNTLWVWQTPFQACFPGSSLPFLSSSDEIQRNAKDLTVAGSNGRTFCIYPLNLVGSPSGNDRRYGLKQSPLNCLDGIEL